MMQSRSISKWKARHAIVVWIGIVLNFGFVIPLILCPEWILGLFDIMVNQLIWPRFAGLLLGILSIFYIPATLDIDRFRVFAWLAIFPSRSLGSVFFFLAVFVFDQPLGYIAGTLLDGTIGIISLACLLRITRLEQEMSEGSRR